MTKAPHGGFYLFEGVSGKGALIEHLFLEHAFREAGLESLYAWVWEKNSSVYKLHTDKFSFSRDTSLDAEHKNGDEIRRYYGLRLYKTVWEEKRNSIKTNIERVFKIGNVTWES